MTRRATEVALLWCAAIIQTPGCAADSAREEFGGSRAIRFVDDAGVEIELPRPPQRILSLVPSATEILVALGQETRFVGRTDYDTEPALAHLPSVGRGLRPSLERVVALDVDVVVRFRAESDPVTPRQLDASGIPHVAIRPDRVEDIRRIIGLLGSMVGREARADSLRARMDQDLAAASAEASRRGSFRVALLGGDPPTVAGPRTFLSELLRAAGAENAFSDLQELYAPISPEEVLRRDVDLVLAPEATPIPASLRHMDVRRIPLHVLTPGLRLGESVRLLSSLMSSDRER